MFENNKIAEPGKIALLHYTCPPVVGGVEAVMGAHARLFAASGYPVTIIAGRGPVPEGKTPGIRTVIEPLIDSKSERLNALNRELEKGYVPSDFEIYCREIYEKLAGLLEGYQACFAHNVLTLHKNLPLTAALLKLTGDMSLNLVSWCHDLAWTNPLYLPALYEDYPWNLLKQNTPGVTYVAISPLRQKEIVTTFEPPLTPEQVPVVPNGVFLTEFLNIGPETREIIETCGLGAARREGALLLLLPARITRRKNIELGIKLASALKAKGYPVRMVVTGPPGPHNPRSDEYVRELFALREQLNLRQEIIFLMESWSNEDGTPRPVGDEVIADLFRYCDALFFPSAQEGFGIPLLEAGMTRLPVFCSDIVPFREIGEENVVFFKPDADPEELAGLITRRLENDPAFRLRRSVLEKYTWDSIFERQILPLVEARNRQ